MVFQVVNKSSFAFETDLPHSARNIHPSGVLHAFRSTPDTTSSNSGLPNREEHAFAWIYNSLHIELALKHLEKFGFHRSNGIVFIPYSSKKNWLNRYPHAAPALECTENGKVVVFLNWRPYPNGLGELGSASSQANRSDNAGGTATGDAIEVHADNDIMIEDRNANNDGRTPKKRKEYKYDKVVRDENNPSKKRYKYKSRTPNMLQDNSFLADPERDELHVEIYNYFSWFHSKLEELLKRQEASSAGNGNDNVDDEDSLDDNEVRSEFERKLKHNKGVDLSELKDVLEKLESSFVIIPNVKSEMETEQEEKAAENAEAAAAAEEIEQEQMAPKETSTTTQQKTAPFLEEALSTALEQLVAAREQTGKPRRRSRKRQRKRVNNPRRNHSRTAGDWDEFYQKLLRYREEYGDCVVTKGQTKEDPQLYHWVTGLRTRKLALERQGVQVEEALPGKKILAKQLTPGRLEKLNSIGFVWSNEPAPKVPWEDRFRDCLDYYEENNGKWPSQSMGQLGEWVHNQRMLYRKRDENYMKTKFSRLDEVGFEWTPRGNTRMNWDEGFEMLMDFGRINGHYHLPNPSNSNADDGLQQQPTDKKSDAYRLYKWVESLHGMYRSYKLGRQSGSLSDERVVLLIKHGFVFRDN